MPLGRQPTTDHFPSKSLMFPDAAEKWHVAQFWRFSLKRSLSLSLSHTHTHTHTHTHSHCPYSLNQPTNGSLLFLKILTGHHRSTLSPSIQQYTATHCKVRFNMSHAHTVHTLYTHTHTHTHTHSAAPGLPLSHPPPLMSVSLVALSGKLSAPCCCWNMKPIITAEILSLWLH